MSAIVYGDLVDMAREAVSWAVNDLDGGTVGVEGLLDVAREGIRDGVDAQLIYTADIVATWEDLHYPDVPEDLEDLDMDLSSMVRTATYWALVEGEGLGPDAAWEDLHYPDVPEDLADLDTDLSSMVRTATYWALVEGEGLGPDAAWDGMDQALALRAREHAVDMGADDVDEYLEGVMVFSDLRDPLWDYLNGGDVDDLRVALEMVKN